MSAAAVVSAALLFAAWQAAIFAVSIPIARALGFARSRIEEQVLAVIAIEITIEASLAGLFSFLGINSSAAYWVAAAAAAVTALVLRDSLRQFARALRRFEPFRRPRMFGIMAALLAPLVFLSFRPVEEIDSINYLHYLIEWMANRATPYTFATNYVAFWELSFLPAWMITRVDLFFPLLALKAIVLLALGAWLVGRELGLRRALLAWTVFAALTLRHYWFEFSGVPTLKNDALHGFGFVLLVLVVMRAARGPMTRADAVLFAFGCAFSAVKYTGIFSAGLAVGLVLYLQRAWIPCAVAAIFTFFTSGHYYLHNSLAYGSPFYPFQINLGPIHLPGTADLTGTSILYSLRNPETWRLLFAPEQGLSPAGLLFPAILAGTLLAAIWIAIRPPSRPTRYAALLLLAGWFLYFRSVYSASASAGDLVFLRSSLNTIRYVDGALAVSELFLISLLKPWPRIAGLLVAINLASRLWILYSKLNPAVFSPRVVAGTAMALFVVSLAVAGWLRRHAALANVAAVLCLLAADPVLVQRNRVLWTTWWNDLKPRFPEVRSAGLIHLALEDGGYFAGHVVAAGNPVDLLVRSVLPEEFTGGPANLVILVTPGSSPRLPDLERWGYRVTYQGQYGGLYTTLLK